jgi:hypothetical protein
MSKLGRTGGGGGAGAAGAAAVPVGAAMLAVWLAAGAAPEAGAGAVVPVDAALEPAAVPLPELLFEGVVAVVLGGAAAGAWVFWPVDPSLVEGWLVVPWLVEPWLVEP